MVSTRKAQPTTHKLHFHEKLVGKGLSTDALQRKLKSLHTELADIDQDNVDTNSLASVRKELISTSILLHKDKGVKAYAACCLADLLRLYAPDAPYTATELKDIFQFFSRQLHAGLKAPSGPHFTEYYYLLESLSNVKSIVLVCDLPQAEELMSEIFRNFFDLANQDMPSNVHTFMGDILVALVDECNTIPQDVLEVLLSQFLSKTDPGDGGLRLAIAVCNEGAEKLQRYVSQYFTDIILQHSRGEDLEDLRAAHSLIKELNRDCPTLLLNVVPQLEEELRVDELDIRLMATETLGTMFGEKMSLGSGELAKKYPSTWRTWLLRQNDKAVAVRVTLLDSISSLLLNHPEQRVEAEDILRRKLLDPDEKVRVAACKVCSRLDYEIVLQHISVDTLKVIGGRTLDKKAVVRQEAAVCLAKLYRSAYAHLELLDGASISHISWIPNDLLHALAQPNPEIRALVENTFCNYILPLPADKDEEPNWTQHLTVLLQFIDEKGLAGLCTLAGLQPGRTNLLNSYVTSCEDNNGGVIDEHEEEVVQKLRSIIQRLAANFPDPTKTSDDLWSFAKLNDKRTYKLLRSCIDAQADIKTLAKSKADFFQRLENNASSIVPTFRTVWQKFAPWVVNVTSIPALVKTLQRSDNGLVRKHTSMLLSKVSKFNPALLKPHVGELAKALAGEASEALAEVSLQALSSVFVDDPALAPSDRRLADKAVRCAEGSHPKPAKFAARLLAHSRNKAQLTTNLAKSLATKLGTASPEQLVGHLSALAELAKSAPDAFESCSDITMQFILKKLFMRDDRVVRNEEEWADDPDVPLGTLAKEYAIRICTNRCLSHASGDQASDIAKPVINLLYNILETGGMPFQNVKQSLVDKSRMRAQAAASLLKLARSSVYDKVIGQQLLTLALTAQDMCFGVRLYFINKMIKYGSRMQIPPRYNVIPFLTVHDPESEPREKARSYVLTCMRRLPRNAKVACFDMIFPRLLHLLAHHPDFSTSVDDLSEMAKYVRFYIDLVCTAENLPLLWHLAGRLKTVEDTEASFSKNVYMMSELAQHLLKRLAATHNWSISNYPAKVELPGDVFVRFRDSSKASAVQHKVYLPDDILVQLQSEASRPTKTVPVKRRRLLASDKENIPSERTPARSRKRQRRPKTDIDEESSEGTALSDVDENNDGEEAMNSPDMEGENDDSDLTSLEEGDSEQLGRGARGKAKAKAAKRVRKSKGRRG
ncbi:cohesin-associated protein Pds5 [Calocera cornea HHB12733]|uniref:Cohesin-associated protein Pds5 n=1 Tax=Calocera cornea HHB12733 TaxID=1353952 RepID=A0A165JDS1_9BASI|nr:cohesin-associated protein Pds5 [Calocera cornea HHB12733]